MKYIVDRIENGLAVCEKDDLSTVKISIDRLPESIHEGSVLIEKDGSFYIDEAEELLRRKRIFDLQSSLFDGED